MREYAIVRQYIDPYPFMDLFGLMFPPFFDLSRITIEVVEATKIPESYVAIGGAIASVPEYDVYVADISEYQYVLLPTVRISRASSVVSGLTDAQGNALTQRVSLPTITANDSVISAYVLLPVTNDSIIAESSQLSGYSAPILGIKDPTLITPLINPMPSPDDDDRSAEPEPDEPKTEPEEPETRSTKKK